MTTGPYARLYLCLVDDPKFEAIYDDDHHFAAWCRLLMIAEPAWPASAHLPSTVRRASVRALVDAGLIDLQPAGRYRIHGLDAEREQRRQHAQTASNARWNAPSNARASGPAMPYRVKPSTTEPSTARAGLPNLSHAVAEAWSDATGRNLMGSGAFASEYIDDATRRHGSEKVAAAIEVARRTFEVIPTPQQLAVAVRGRLDPLPDSRDVGKAERESENAASSARRVRATITKLHYQHGEPDPRCDLCSEVTA